MFATFLLFWITPVAIIKAVLSYRHGEIFVIATENWFLWITMYATILFFQYLEHKWRIKTTIYRIMLVLRHLWVMLHGIQLRYLGKILSISLILFLLEVVSILPMTSIKVSHSHNFFLWNAFKLAKQYGRLSWCKAFPKTVIEHLLVVMGMFFVLCQSHQVSLSDCNVSRWL